MQVNVSAHRGVGGAGGCVERAVAPELEGNTRLHTHHINQLLVSIAQEDILVPTPVYNYLKYLIYKFIPSITKQEMKILQEK